MNKIIIGAAVAGIVALGTLGAPAALATEKATLETQSAIVIGIAPAPVTRDGYSVTFIPIEGTRGPIDPQGWRKPPPFKPTPTQRVGGLPYCPKFERP